MPKVYMKGLLISFTDTLCYTTLLDLTVSLSPWKANSVVKFSDVAKVLTLCSTEEFVDEGPEEAREEIEEVADAGAEEDVEDAAADEDGNEENSEDDLGLAETRVGVAKGRSAGKKKITNNNLYDAALLMPMGGS